MLKIACCLALLALAAQPNGSNAFFSEDSGKLRMIGGDVVQDSSTYSFQVAIRPLMSQGGQSLSTNVCSGVLIEGQRLNLTTNLYDKAYYILTSASCALSGLTYNVWVGTNTVRATDPPTASISRSDVIVHPEYFSSGMSASDLAIMPAPDAITALFTTPTAGRVVTAARLPNVDNAGTSYLAANVNMAGWGYPNDVFDAASPRLRQLNAYVVPNFYCSARHLGKAITSRHICTGGLINKGPCTGDAGAPLIIRNSNSGNRVVGLATMVPTSGCSKGKPGVFTRLGNYLSWISSVTFYDAEQ